MALRTAPFHRSLTRHNLFMGGDREMMMMVWLISFTLIVGVLSWFTCVYGILFWLVCSFLLRQMAKADPLMRHVYLRHIRYKKYYSAHSTPYLNNTRDY